MKTLASLAIIAGLALGACSLTAAQKAQLEQQALQAGEQTAACIASQAMNGVTSAATIAVTCGVADAPTVIAIIQTLVASLAAHAPDGGVGAGMSSGDLAKLVAALKAVH
jgi:hypothetical protein